MQRQNHYGNLTTKHGNAKGNLQKIIGSPVQNHTPLCLFLCNCNYMYVYLRISTEILLLSGMQEMSSECAIARRGSTG